MKSRNSGKKRSLIKKVIIAVLILIAAIIIYIAINALSVYYYSSVDETRNADAAIVLGAAAYPHAPSPVYKERLNHAIKLFNENKVRYIILTGGYGKGNTKSDAMIGAEYIIENGVPDSAILLEEKSTVTEENLKNAAQIMRDNGLNSALIVSDPIHMKRAMLMAKDSGIDAFSSPTQTSKYQSGTAKFDFLKRETFYYIGYKWIRIFK